MSDSPFKIKSYCMTELAQLYKPDVLPSSALKTFNGWIERNPELKAGLAETGFIPGETRSLTPFQVRIIVYYLGDP